MFRALYIYAEVLDIPDELFWQLRARAAEENISLKVLVEKPAHHYLRSPLRRIGPSELECPSIGDGKGAVLDDPSTWWEAINELSALRPLARALTASGVTGAKGHGARIAAICGDHGVQEFWAAARDSRR